MRDRRCHDLMVVGFTTAYAISAYHQKLGVRIMFMARCTRYNFM